MTFRKSSKPGSPEVSQCHWTSGTKVALLARLAQVVDLVLLGAVVGGIGGDEEEVVPEVRDPRNGDRDRLDRSGGDRAGHDDAAEQRIDTRVVGVVAVRIVEGDHLERTGCVGRALVADVDLGATGDDERLRIGHDAAGADAIDDEVGQLGKGAR